MAATSLMSFLAATIATASLWLFWHSFSTSQGRVSASWDGGHHVLSVNEKKEIFSWGSVR